MTQMHDAISASGWLDRMSQLAVRNGVHLSSLQQKDGRDLELVFASAYLWFPADRLLDERAANEVLKTFLAGPGVMLDTDHVELRRWLVDTAFLRRSDYGTDYHRGTLPMWLADAAAALDAGQIGRAVSTAREAHGAQREARRQAWLASQIEVTEEERPAEDADATYMRLALDQAHNAWALAEVPVGAVVVRDGQVIATGFNYGFEAGKVAGFANIGRIVLIPAGVLFIYFATLSKDIRTEKISYWEVIKEKFPFFVFGFVAVWVANILHFFPKPAVYAMETVMVWFFTLCFVGIGLQTKFADVKQAGPGGVIMGWVAGLLKVGITLAIVLILMKFGIF